MVRVNLVVASRVLYAEISNDESRGCYRQVSDESPKAALLRGVSKSAMCVKILCHGYAQGVAL